MKKASKMIDLGRKSSVETAKPDIKQDEPSYPDIHLSPDTEIPFPKGSFMARVRMKVKTSSKTEDEKGKARHTYHLAIHGIHPEFEAAEEASAKEEPKADAAMSLMESMGRARDKKFMEADTD